VNPENEPLLKPAQVALFFGVTLHTLRRWTNAGLLPCIRTAGGHRRFRTADVLALQDKQWRA
jgi:excisionase family DNA binding protein